MIRLLLGRGGIGLVVVVVVRCSLFARVVVAALSLGQRRVFVARALWVSDEVGLLSLACCRAL